MPIEFELELADNDAPIITYFNTVYTHATTSTSWRIESCQLKCDSLSLDNSLDNSYVNHLLVGNTLNNAYATYISSIQTITSADCQVNVSRSLTALRSVFVSLDKMFIGWRVRWHNKSWNTFYSTLAGNRSEPTYTYESDDEVKHLQLSIGSKLYPEYLINSHAECFYNLRKSLGVQANDLHALDIKGHEYRNHNFVVGFDIEKMLGLASTGINTKNSLMTIRLKTLAEEYKPSRMHIVLVAQQVIEVSDTGITIVD